MTAPHAVRAGATPAARSLPRRLHGPVIQRLGWLIVDQFMRVRFPSGPPRRLARSCLPTVGTPALNRTMRVQLPSGLPCLRLPLTLSANGSGSPVLIRSIRVRFPSGSLTHADVVFNSSTRPCHGRSTGANPVIRSGRRALLRPFPRAPFLVPWSNGSRLPVVSRPIRVRFPSGSPSPPRLLMALSSIGLGSRIFTSRKRVRSPSGLPIRSSFAGVM